MRDLARYVGACTTPADRVVVTPFIPEFYFYARRGFATTYVPRGFTGSQSPSKQQETLANLRTGSVPLIIMEAQRYADLGADAEEVHRYLEASYRIAGEAPFGGREAYRVLVDRRLEPTGTYEPLGLPCYA